MMKPDKSLVSVCGLFCPGCGVFYSTKENNEPHLQRLADRMNIPVNEMRCNGCRTDAKTSFCRNCFMYKCASEKGIDFCGECQDYPCHELKDFQSKMPHRVEIWKSQEEIKKVGWEAWFNKMAVYYSCPECSTINGWYDMKCRSCGHEPGSDFVRENKDVLTRIPK